VSRSPGPGTDDEFVWEAPPEKPFVRSVYQEPIEKCRKAQGRWARIRLSSGSSIYSSRKSLERVLDDDERWEVLVSRIGKDQYGLYLRYRTDGQMETVKE
jgi:hypothetical protein